MFARFREVWCAVCQLMHALVPIGPEIKRGRIFKGVAARLNRNYKRLNFEVNVRDSPGDKPFNLTSSTSA